MQRAGFPIPIAGEAGNQPPHAVMLALAGLAMAGSPVNLTLLPLVVGFLIARRAPLRLWLIAPLAFLLAVTAIRLWGLPWTDPTSLYVGQANASPRLSSDAPTIWAILQALPWINHLPFGGLALASAVGIAAWLTARFARPATAIWYRAAWPPASCWSGCCRECIGTVSCQSPALPSWRRS